MFADGVPLHLPAKEFDTLLMLVEHNGHALTKEEMMSALWHDSFVEESNLAKQISRLRKIFNTNDEEYIETLPKHGYRFTAELRRSVVESEDAIILEKRTVKRVTFAVEKEIEPERPALPPAKRVLFTFPRLALALLVAVVGLGLSWYFGRSNAEPIDPYAPVRLTDNPNDDTGPGWTKDGRIRFARVFPDNRIVYLVMNADGSGQTEIPTNDGRKIFSWSPDEQKILYQKQGDLTKVYLSNADGSGEILLPFRGGAWSPDSKMLAYRSRVSGDNHDIFIYWIETGKSRNITNSEAFDADPSFSPDGKKVVFASGRDGNPELYSVNLDGSEPRRLTHSPAIDAHGAYSPDGTKILFGSNRENENGDLYLMNIDGSDPVKITNWDKSNESAGIAAWSPDGTRIAFWSDRNGKDDIYVMSAETVRPKPVLADPERDLKAPSYSPDGRRVVYSTESEDRTGELRILDLESQTTGLVIKTELPAVAADWAPDGNWIAYSDRVNGNSEVLRVKPDGSELQNLTTDPASDGGPEWSPDGKRILFSSGRGEPPGITQLFIMNSDGTDPRPVTPRKGWEGDPTWSPDGNAILFVCDREDSPGNLLDVCQINPDGSGEKRVLFHRDHDFHPAVSPDGDRIAFCTRSDGNIEIYLMNRDGSGLVRLTRDPADDLWPEWSPDGTKLVFSSNRSGKFAIYEIAVPGP